MSVMSVRLMFICHINRMGMSDDEQYSERKENCFNVQKRTLNNS